MLLLLLHLPLTWQPIDRPFSVITHRCSCNRASAIAQQAEGDRKEYLRQLFGDNAAERLAPVPEEAEVEPDIAMLQDGIQVLRWGETRLVDVAMAVGPLELELQPLLAASTLLCVRLDMPLGMRLEEDAPDPAKPTTILKNLTVTYSFFVFVAVVVVFCF